MKSSLTLDGVYVRGAYLGVLQDKFFKFLLISLKQYPPNLLFYALEKVEIQGTETQNVVSSKTISSWKAELIRTISQHMFYSIT